MLAAIWAAAPATAVEPATFADAADDSVLVDDEGNIIGPAPPGHPSDITFLDVSGTNGHVVFCVNRNKQSIGNSTAVVIDVGSLRLVWEISGGVPTMLAQRGGATVPGVTFPANASGSRVCAQVPAREVANETTLSALSFDRPQANELRGLDGAGPFTVDLSTADEPTATNTATPTATATPTLTATTEPTSTPTPTPVPPTSAPEPTSAEDQATATSVPTATATATEPPAAGETVEPEPTPTATTQPTDTPVAAAGGGDEGGPADEPGDGGPAPGTTDGPPSGDGGGLPPIFWIGVPLAAALVLFALGFVLRPKIPVLGKVPVLGGAFRRTGDDEDGDGDGASPTSPPVPPVRPATETSSGTGDSQVNIQTSFAEVSRNTGSEMGLTSAGDSAAPVAAVPPDPQPSGAGDDAEVTRDTTDDLGIEFPADPAPAPSTIDEAFPPIVGVGAAGSDDIEIPPPPSDEGSPPEPDPVLLTEPSPRAPSSSAVTPAFVPADDAASFPLHAPIAPGRQISYEEALLIEQSALGRYRSEPEFYDRAVAQRRSEADEELLRINQASYEASSANPDEFDPQPYLDQAEAVRDALDADLADLAELRDNETANNQRWFAINDELERQPLETDPIDGPRISLRAGRHTRPLDTLLGSDAFYPTVEIPNTETPPDDQITVTFTSSSRPDENDESEVSDTEEVVLTRVGLHNGNWVYSTEAPVTLRDAHSTGLRDTIGLGFDSGDRITVEYLGESITLHGWDTPQDQWAGEVAVQLEGIQDQLEAAREGIDKIVMQFDAALEDLNQTLAKTREVIETSDLPDEERERLLDQFEEAAEQARQRLVAIHNDPEERAKAYAEIDRRMKHVESGLTVVNGDTLLQDRAIRGQMYANLALNPNQDVGEAMRRARERVDEEQRDALTQGMKGVAIAFGQTIADAMLWPTLYSIAVGEDFVTGRRLTASERIQTAVFMVVMAALFIQLATIASAAKVPVGGKGWRSPRKPPSGRAHTRGGQGTERARFRTGNGPAGQRQRPPAATGRSAAPPVDEVFKPLRNVLAPRLSLDKALPPLQRVDPPRPVSPGTPVPPPRPVAVPPPRGGRGAGRSAHALPSSRSGSCAHDAGLVGCPRRSVLRIT